MALDFLTQLLTDYTEYTFILFIFWHLVIAIEDRETHMGVL